VESGITQLDTGDIYDTGITKRPLKDGPVSSQTAGRVSQRPDVGDPLKFPTGGKW
jgi:hypothetical protein